MQLAALRLMLEMADEHATKLKRMLEYPHAADGLSRAAASDAAHEAALVYAHVKDALEEIKKP